VCTDLKIRAGSSRTHDRVARLQHVCTSLDMHSDSLFPFNWFSLAIPTKIAARNSHHVLVLIDSKKKKIHSFSGKLYLDWRSRRYYEYEVPEFPRDCISRTSSEGICRNTQIKMPYGRHRYVSSYRSFHARDYIRYVDTKKQGTRRLDLMLRRLDILSISMSSVTGLLR